MKKYSILLVDDSPNVIKALVRTFKYSENYTVYTASSAKEAMDILQKEKIDLLITDENMPETNGTELLNTVRALFPDVIRFMLTGETDIEVAKKAINSGQIYRFFTKPCDDYELLIAVRYAFEQKELERENSKLRVVVQEQKKMLDKLETQYPGITTKNLSEDGAFILDGSD